MRVHKAFLATTSLCSGLMLATLAAPAWAQTTTPPPQAPQSPAPPPPNAVSEVVITGSHIKSTNFTSPDPLTVLTSDQAQLTGTTDISRLLQLSAVAASGTQINNEFSQFVNTGGPGVNTLSIFGLGAQRTLILIDGERAGPAGTSGTVGPFDLNTIPLSMVDHVDIEKDGASSTYGSDAIAGVVNIVTKKNLDGGDLVVTGNPSEGGGGNQWDVNGSWGKTFDKGYFSAGFDVYRQDPLYTGERGYLNCSRELVKGVDGDNLDVIDPTTGQDKCFNNGVSNAVVDEGQDNGFVLYRPGTLGPQISGLNNISGFFPTGVQLCGASAALCISPTGAGVNTAATRANLALEPLNNPLLNSVEAISPVSRYSVFLFGGYDLTPTTQLYGSFIFNQRDSNQNSVAQLFGATNPAAPQNPGFADPLPVLLETEPSSQTVDYFRVVGGVKGSLPSWANFQNWTYDVFAQYSLSDASYTQRYIPTDLANAVFDSDNAEGCDQSLVTQKHLSCVPFNLFTDVLRGGLTPQQTNFLYRNEQGHTNYDTAYVEGNITGDLWQLPAGALSAALGFDVRHEGLDDVPGQDFINDNVFNFTTEGVTAGTENIGEFYGELQVPVLKDLPFIKALSLDLSGRFSDYSTYGSNETYKLTAKWAVNDQVLFRATYGTAFRAPDLFEEFLANQTGFFNQLGVDPCIEYGTSGVNATVQKNCASLGIPSTYNGQGSGLTATSGGGGSALKPETDITDSVGVVFTPTVWGQRISLSVDYINADIENQITQFGVTNIADACFNSADFPNNAFCKLITRNGSTASGSFSAFNIEDISNPFINISQEIQQQVDAVVRWQTDLPHDITLSMQGEFLWTLYNRITLNGTQVNEFLGQIGEPRFDGNYDWTFSRGPWSFNWLLYLVGRSSDQPFSNPNLMNFDGTGQNVVANYVASFYTNSDVSIRRKFDKFTVVFGVNNLFNAPPPAISIDDENSPGREGVTPLAISQYDVIGRSYYLQIDAKF
jgi:iron complex outermembrane recepter protein